MLYRTLKVSLAALIALTLSAPGLSEGQAATTGAGDPTPSDIEHRHAWITTSEGLRLSAFVSRKAGIDGKLPALFLTQWVACGSIAPSKDDVSQAERIALAAGYVLIRVDRAGEGASEGPGCNNLDYDTEVRHYREALDQLRQHDWVDANQIVIFGSSLGATTAPLVARDKNVAGVLTQGGGALTYFERMLHFDRQQLERQGDFSPEKIHSEMLRRIEFQRRYLLEKMTPAQIAAAHPHLAGVWESLFGTNEEPPHYGRPYAWHWQAADKNWLAAWAELDVPVMVIYGEYDQFEPRHGHRVIVDTINRLRPGSATWLEVPRAGHGLGVYRDPVAAYAWEGGERRPEVFVEPAAAWLKDIVQ